jgi:hypothetical protein
MDMFAFVCCLCDVGRSVNYRLTVLIDFSMIVGVLVWVCSSVSPTQSGFAVLLPVHDRPASPADTVTQVNGETIRSNHVIGMILGVFLLDELLFTAQDAERDTLQLSIGRFVLASTDPSDPIPIGIDDTYHVNYPFRFQNVNFQMQCKHNTAFTFDSAYVSLRTDRPYFHCSCNLIK